MESKIKSYVGDDIIIECNDMYVLGRNIFMDSNRGRVKIARVYDIIGNVESPYAVAKIFKQNKRYIKSYEELINKTVYLQAENKNVKKIRRNGKPNWKGKRRQKN
ncbi:hypothetical protein BEH94_08105 [Candidatus Altiarchaeales archaeon WOR_SM1_SCG]|nr:hypothetical protein BEH94_08105 [Candidatus Altiarchaeales archaeon WOR_SM1_SCG]